MATDHIWTLISRTDEAISGEDDYPTEMDKLNAKTFILYLLPRDESEGVQTVFPMEFEIPEGYSLVFKRRNWIHKVQGADGEQSEVREHKYIVSIKPLTLGD